MLVILDSPAVFKLFLDLILITLFWLF